MKIGEAHRAQSSYLYSANTIGALIHPAPIGVADRTGKKFYWRTVPGHHCLLAEGDFGAPIYWRTEAPLRQYIGAPRPPCTSTLLVLERDKSSDFSISCNKFHIAYWRTEHVGAPCLFSSQSPINWALQTGNGNTLRKRRWQH